MQATGFIALVLVNKYGFMIGADIPLNTFNICGSAVLGVPFVVCLVIIEFFIENFEEILEIL